MSSIKKSASFRSRIPVRRTKPIPRRCYSPPPLSINHIDSNNTAGTRPTVHHTKKGRYNNHHHHRHQQQQNQQQHHLWSHGSYAPSSKCATYSSSSYSSGDESQESETPVQVKVISAIKNVLMGVGDCSIAGMRVVC